MAGRRRHGTLLDGRVKLVPMDAHGDARGTLVPIEFRDLPFPARRVFVVRDVPSGTIRGGHAHKIGQQLLVCLAGRITVHLFHGGLGDVVRLDNRAPGLLLEAGVWSAQVYSSPRAIALVFASEPYDQDGYLDADAAARRWMAKLTRQSGE